MNFKKWNEIFAYGFFAVGAFKLIVLVLIFLKLGSNLNAISNGGYASDYDLYRVLNTILGFAECMLAIGSVIMIIKNSKKQPEVITGYIIGLGAVLLELIMPRMFAVFGVFIECGMFMMGGTKIKNKNSSSNVSSKNTKQMVKNTEWFYGKDDK